MTTIDLTPDCTIEDAAIAVVTTANHTGEECRAKFNGFDLVALPLVTDEDDLIAAYWAWVREGIDSQNEPQRGDELAAEVILILVAMFEDMLKKAMRDYEVVRAKAREVVSRCADTPECDGSHIKAALDIFRADQQFGRKFHNGQKAMLFIAAVELMQERAG